MIGLPDSKGLSPIDWAERKRKDRKSGVAEIRAGDLLMGADPDEKAPHSEWHSRGGWAGFLSHMYQQGRRGEGISADRKSGVPVDVCFCPPSAQHILRLHLLPRRQH